MKVAHEGHLMGIMESIYAHARADLTLLENVESPYEIEDPDGLKSLTDIALKDLEKDITKIMDDIRSYIITIAKYYEQNEDA